MQGEIEPRPDILHLDMDCFFAAAEALDDPALSGRAVIVGGLGDRGVVSSASYEARALGVHSAMPMAEARRLAPNAVYRAPRFERYSALSDQLLELLQQVTPVVEPISLDEAFLDVSGAHRVLGSSRKIAEELRQRVRSDLGLTCSVGGGCTLLVAKLASKAAKPPIGRDEPGLGVLIVDKADEQGFLYRHRARALPGIGPRTDERLRRMGILSVQDLAETPTDRLVRVFGPAHGTAISELSRGIDHRKVNPHRPMRSIGREETFKFDVLDRQELLSRARAYADSVAASCRANGVACRTVSIKVKFGDFSLISRSWTLAQATNVGSEIAAVAQRLLGEVDLKEGVRLLGVHASNLEKRNETTRQLAMFAIGEDLGLTEAAVSHREVEHALDEVRQRFGSSAVTSLGASQRPQVGAPRPPRPKD